VRAGRLVQLVGTEGFTDRVVDQRGLGDLGAAQVAPLAPVLASVLILIAPTGLVLVVLAADGTGRPVVGAREVPQGVRVPARDGVQPPRPGGGVAGALGRVSFEGAKVVVGRLEELIAALELVPGLLLELLDGLPGRLLPAL